MILRKPNEPEPTRLSEIISAAMEEQGLSIKGLKNRLSETDLDLEMTYEHVRRIVRGIGNPSRTLLKALSKALDLPFDKLEQADRMDKAASKGYDRAVMIDIGKDPTVEPLERVWKRLTEDQRDTVLHLAQDLARRNKREAVTAAS